MGGRGAEVRIVTVVTHEDMLRCDQNTGVDPKTMFFITLSHVAACRKHIR